MIRNVIEFLAVSCVSEGESARSAMESARTMVKETWMQIRLDIPRVHF